MPPVNAVARRPGVQSAEETSLLRNERAVSQWDEPIAACRRYGAALLIAATLLFVWALLRAG